MNSIRIGDVDFPFRALSEMQYLRDKYQQQANSRSLSDAQNLHIESPNVSSPNLVSMRDFMNRFPNTQLRILLPRTRPVREIIGNDIWRWMADLDRDRLMDLHNAAHTLGYSILLNITSLILSEDINYESL